MPRLALPTVTLCAATSVNIPATIRAMHKCLDQVQFGESLLLTDIALPDVDPRIQVVPIDRITSGRAYSEFVLRELANFISTSHALIVQWDGFVVDAGRWEAGFLEYDYIGAPWPQFSDGHEVGNGGFSLRSKKLLEACRGPEFQLIHPEDVAICRRNRGFLERKYGIRFADRSTAERFSFEREKPKASTFGFHGVFNMITLLGGDRFWDVYSDLDDRSTALVDYWLLMRQLGNGPSSIRRQIQLTLDRLTDVVRR